MPAINIYISGFSHSMMVIFVALSLGLSANAYGWGLKPSLLRRRQGLNSHHEPALDRRLHERGIHSRHRHRDDLPYFHDQAQMNRLTYLLNYLNGNNHNVMGAIRGKRACTTTMDELISRYKSFHDTLATFLNDYPTHLKSDHENSALKYVSAILDLLPKNSPYITSGNVDEIRDGINKTLEMTQYVLDKGRHFLKASADGWFRTHTSLVVLSRSMLYLSIGCVVQAGSSQSVKEESGGIGGGNTAKDSGPSSDTLIKVRNVAVYLLQNSPA